MMGGSLAWVAPPVDAEDIDAADQDRPIEHDGEPAKVAEVQLIRYASCHELKEGTDRIIDHGIPSQVDYQRGGYSPDLPDQLRWGRGWPRAPGTEGIES